MMVIDKFSRQYRKHYATNGRMEVKQDIVNGTVEFITYIGGDAYSAPVILKSDGTTQQYMYLHRDYLGSIVAVTNQTGSVIEKRLFDAWGDIKAIQDGNGNVLTKMIIIERGYTGHEHLQGVNIIHMNGRLYDPVVHRFLQPDNFIQDPTNTQSYNRYAYCINNPLKYTDKNGEFFLSFLTAIVETVANVFTHGVNVQNYDYQKTNMAWNIDKGLLQGNFGQILGKFTWGIVDTVIGNFVSHGYNWAGEVKGVTYLDGATAIETKRSSNEAFTIGSYINGPKGFKADWKDHLFVHEYGHYVQGQWFGPLYLPVVASTSVLSAIGVGGSDHGSRWFEVQASRMGAKHFDEKYGSGATGYNQQSENYFDYNAFSNGYNTNYKNPRTDQYTQSRHQTSDARFSIWDVIIPISTLSLYFIF